jgi:hypothetical protein
MPCGTLGFRGILPHKAVPSEMFGANPADLGLVKSTLSQSSDLQWDLWGSEIPASNWATDREWWASIVGSRESDGLDLKVLGPNGTDTLVGRAGEHQGIGDRERPAEIAAGEGGELVQRTSHILISSAVM